MTFEKWEHTALALLAGTMQRLLGLSLHLVLVFLESLGSHATPHPKAAPAAKEKKRLDMLAFVFLLSARQVMAPYLTAVPVSQPTGSLFM